MDIVITDGYTLTQDDLNWDEFSSFGHLKYYDRTPPALIRERCLDASIIITNKTPIGAQVIENSKDLKLIVITATGYNTVDAVAARARGIPVCNVPGYGTASVAQHSFSLLLELSNQTGQHIQSVRNGDWSRSPDWCYKKMPIIELRDKVMGIIGFGRIGEQMGLLAKAFGMSVIYHSPSVKDVPWANAVDLDTLFGRSDFISLHCPLTPENIGLVNRDNLSRMKPSAYLINSSRGGLVNEMELADALRGGVLAGAALDVLVSEPPPADHPLIGLPNCLITPHCAWLSFEARRRVMQITHDNIRLAMKGTPQNLVNGC